jgi:hypothetical protein
MPMKSSVKASPRYFLSKVESPIPPPLQPLPLRWIFGDWPPIALALDAAGPRDIVPDAYRALLPSTHRETIFYPDMVSLEWHRDGGGLAETQSRRFPLRHTKEESQSRHRLPDTLQQPLDSSPWPRRRWLSLSPHQPTRYPILPADLAVVVDQACYDMVSSFLLSQGLDLSLR